jgi:hypothetical protein
MGGGNVAVVLGNLAASRPVGPVGFVAKLPAEDDIESRDKISLGDAEGQSFIIEYVDSRGRSSTRRVTVWSIEAGAGGMPCLYAKCHERQAMRQFRVDRIRSCADYDGVVHEDVMAFLSECFGIQIAVSTAEAAPVDRWANVLATVRADAVLLACVSHSDGHAHVLEAEFICDYLAFVAERQIGPLTDTEIVALHRHVKRLRPSEDMIGRALEALLSADQSRKSRLLRACVQVMDADGVRKSAERDVIADLAFELTGTGLTI